MGSALGAAIVRSIANQRQQQQTLPADNGQSQAARQSLDAWANQENTRSTTPQYAPRTPASELDEWASEVRGEDLRDSPNAARKPPKTKPAPERQTQPNPLPIAKAHAPTVPKDCDAWFEDPPRSGLWFYECKPRGGDRYCLQTLADGQLKLVSCN
jgi:hypothetical protein